MGSTVRPATGREDGLGRRGVLAGLAGLAGCTSMPPLLHPAGPPVRDGAFVMRDGLSLPFRVWRPEGVPDAVILALHGFNDSRDAWEVPGPEFAAAGMAVYGPDQRGFGNTASRGFWPGAATLVLDAAEMLGVLRGWHPRVPAFALGESMGGAVVLRLAASRPDHVAGFVAAAPAVWGRGGMNVLLRSALWVGTYALPGATVVDGGPVRVRASDNISALRRLSRDPLTLHTTRLDTLRGLVDLMDDAVAACPVLPPRTLLLYGGHDEVIPPQATAASWRRLPARVRQAYYPDLHHLLLRDLGRSTPIGDVVDWVRAPQRPPVSGAERAASLWLAGRAAA